jgi:uncharacterized protein DUF3300
MRYSKRTAQIVGIAIAAVFAIGLSIQLTEGQSPPPYSPSQLDRLVSRIALYPDPLLAQVLAAATFPDQIPDAAGWADQHHYLSGEELARAISDDMLPWDPSVQALLPFPSVLEMMASDLAWTKELGDAFLAQREEVMDAIQRMRRKARDFGYLRTNAQIIVSEGPYIEILPRNPEFICVPYYDPLIVFAPPHAGFAVAGAIRFGFGLRIGAAFRPWGWGSNRILWDTHTVIINNVLWGRTWGNRAVYIHPYALRRWDAGSRIERHELLGRSRREREYARFGREGLEEHRRSVARSR